MSQIAVVAQVRVQEGKSEAFLAALTRLLEQAEREPGTLLYLVQRSTDDPNVFWTSEVYADQAAFEAHRASEVPCSRYGRVRRVDRGVTGRRG
jgi:(4S)-4-hydroxy-5-phosphonooxypentane-2,3-dione isomerase